MGNGDRTGITTTVPVEAILAAGLVPVDLNNSFITADDRCQLLSSAEEQGFPVNLCAWVKGVYQAACAMGIKRVVGVTRGDCASTDKLLEIWARQGLETIAFAYPWEPDRREVGRAVASFARRMGVDKEDAERMRKELLPLRKLLQDLDRMTWDEGGVSGYENHLWLVSASDFKGDPESFRKDLESFLEEAGKRTPVKHSIRLGYIGVPPVVDDLYQFLDQRDAAVVFNEVQRQFAMIGDHPDLASQYAAYTYPYSTYYRLADVKTQIKKRHVQGIIHYAQTFCHRQIESIIFREELPVPVLTIEADKPGPIEPRNKTRIEAFIEQVA